MGSSSLHHHQFEDLCQSCFSILDKTQIKALDLQRMGDTYTGQGGGEYRGDQDPDVLRMKRADLVRSSNMRRAILLSQNVMPGPPPLCSICQHTAPVFGNPPRRFSYAELELATAGFSPVNFLAKGGYGSVHRGILPHGQAVAVKQHKFASTQGDKEFCSEVEVLSCAQHRNVVMLIDYCVEGNVHRLLVYEFICNGSLDSHLYGKILIQLQTAQHFIDRQTFNNSYARSFDLCSSFVLKLWVM
jgi:hypothetical protein